jgi:beta-1,4-mannosyl-glycoprotein beta-1,4-N-acetylglucosaminyltransferase
VIVDGFLFNDEFDLLELRLMELGDLVDRFVLVEARHDFQCHLKPLHFEKFADRFSAWQGKITAIVADVEPSPHPAIEHEQRRQIARGFEDLDLSDVVMIGDVDEIPSRKVVEVLRKTPPAFPLVLRQQLYYYRATNAAGLWNGTVVMPRGLGRIDCQGVRDYRHFMQPIPIEPAGWHFSWFGDHEAVARKLRAIDVQRDNDIYDSRLPHIPDPDEDEEIIRRRVLLGVDLFGRDRAYTSVPIVPGVYQPEAIKPWLERHAQYS